MLAILIYFFENNFFCTVIECMLHAFAYPSRYFSAEVQKHVTLMSLFENTSG